MTGFGVSPYGSAPFGIGLPATAPTRTPNVLVPYSVAPQIDPATRQFVLANGTPVMVDGVGQRVLIRLSTDLGSSAMRDLGNTLRSIKRITDNHRKVVDTTVRAALADMVDSGEIAILAIEVDRFGTTGTFVKLTWQKVGETNTRETVIR